MTRARFHAGAAGAILLVSGAAAGAAIGIESLELRGGAPRLLTTGELWLLVLFVAGVLAVLLALSTLLGGWQGPSRLRRRLDERNGPEEDARPSDEDPTGSAVALWLLEVGAGLLVMYALAWLAGAAGWGS